MEDLGGGHIFKLSYGHKIPSHFLGPYGTHERCLGHLERAAFIAANTSVTFDQALEMPESVSVLMLEAINKNRDFSGELLSTLLRSLRGK